jgi:hypothetical protein
VSTVSEEIVPADDLRHFGDGSAKTRDSLFWNLVLPDEQIAVQVYVWVDGRGVAGRQVTVYVPDPARNIVLVKPGIDKGPDCDLDAVELAGLTLTQPEPLRTAELSFESDEVSLEYRFTADHRPFSYAENPDGCPHWMAINRFEQAGTADGVLRLGGREIPFSGVWAHRDHSWGRRHWGWVHHWKWIAAGTPSGASLNAMFHIAKGECGVNGYVLSGGEPSAIVDGQCHVEYDEHMGQMSAQATVLDASGRQTQLMMERFAIVHMPFGSDSRISEAGCRVTIDGEPGAGQLEALWPASYVDRLVSAEQ